MDHFPGGPAFSCGLQCGSWQLHWTTASSCLRCLWQREQGSIFNWHLLKPKFTRGYTQLPERFFSHSKSLSLHCLLNEDVQCCTALVCAHTPGAGIISTWHWKENTWFTRKRNGTGGCASHIFVVVFNYNSVFFILPVFSSVQQLWHFWAK